MKITELSVSNFRSFERLNLELDTFNVLIGANASGKSNFVEIFKFLRDIANHGLQNAVSMQGGMAYLKNVTSDPGQPLSVRVVCEEDEGFTIREQERIIGVRKKQLLYEFSLAAVDGVGRSIKNGGFEVSHDRMTRTYQFLDLGKQNGDLDGVVDTDYPAEVIGTGSVTLTNVKGSLDYSLHLPEGLRPHIELGDLLLFVPASGTKEVELPGSLLLEGPLMLAPPASTPSFGSIRVYDFDPNLSRKSTPVTGKSDLEEDSSNLAVVLKHILEDDQKRRKFSNLIKDLLPFVEDLTTEGFAGISSPVDKSIIFTMREKYYDTYLPASLLSDGTISVIALLIALYFEERPLIVFEEPGRNVHPSLIAKVVSMMEEVSGQRQLIVTTHNPQIVKYADLEALLLISRDDQGFSTISRPAHREDVKTFLENDIGVADLFAQGLLEA
jgi:predicted ATPase